MLENLSEKKRLEFTSLMLKSKTDRLTITSHTFDAINKGLKVTSYMKDGESYNIFAGEDYNKMKMLIAYYVQFNMIEHITTSLFNIMSDGKYDSVADLEYEILSELVKINDKTIEKYSEDLLKITSNKDGDK